MCFSSSSLTASTQKPTFDPVPTHSARIFGRDPSPSSFEVVEKTFFTNSQSSFNFSMSSNSIAAASISSSTDTAMAVSSQILSPKFSSDARTIPAKPRAFLKSNCVPHFTLPTTTDRPKASASTSSSSLSTNSMSISRVESMSDSVSITSFSANNSSSSSSSQPASSVHNNISSILGEFNALYEKSNFDEALKKFNSALLSISTAGLSQKELAALYYKAGVCYANKSNYEAAGEVLTEGYSFDRTNLDIKKMLAFVLGQSAHLKENNPWQSLFEYSLANEFYLECISINFNQPLDLAFKGLFENFAANFTNFTSLLRSALDKNCQSRS